MSFKALGLGEQGFVFRGVPSVRPSVRPSTRAVGPTDRVSAPGIFELNIGLRVRAMASHTGVGDNARYVVKHLQAK